MCVVFVLATPGFKLRDLLHQRDETFSEVMNAPALRFVEKRGITIVDRVGQNYTWKTKTFFENKV